MSTISAINHVPTVPSSLTASPGAVHEAHTMMTLNPEVLRCDTDVQPRLALSEAHIREYAALLQEGHQLGTIVVFQDGSDYYLADGFHRVAAAKSIGLEELSAEIRVGTKRDAMLYACGANKHGKPLSNPDKQRVVQHVLEDAAWGQWSDRAIARHCGVSHVFVAKLRKTLTGNVTSERTYRTKHGTQTTMDTAAIGKPAVPEVSGDASTPHVSHPPAGTTHTAEGAAGAPPTEVVAPALQGQEEDMPTPALADALRQGTDRQAPLRATEGKRDDGSPTAAEEAPTAPMSQHVPLCDALRALTTLPPLDLLIIEMPASAIPCIDRYLDGALSSLRRFATLWKAHRHAEACHLQGQQEQPSLVPEGAAEPQQLSQPAHASRGRETGQAQSRAETEDSIPQSEKTGADYDTTRFYLGKLCPRAHTYRDTGKTLRRQRKGDCVQCHRES